MALCGATTTRSLCFNTSLNGTARIQYRIPRVHQTHRHLIPIPTRSRPIRQLNVVYVNIHLPRDDLGMKTFRTKSTDQEQPSYASTRHGRHHRSTLNPVCHLVHGFCLTNIFSSRRRFIVVLESGFRLQRYSRPAGSSIKLAMHRMLISPLDLVRQCRPFS